jgi:hypothetical protein
VFVDRIEIEKVELAGKVAADLGPSLSIAYGQVLDDIGIHCLIPILFSVTCAIFRPIEYGNFSACPQLSETFDLTTLSRSFGILIFRHDPQRD